MSAKITGVYTAKADDEIPGVDMVTAEADDEIQEWIWCKSKT